MTEALILASNNRILPIISNIKAVLAVPEWRNVFGYDRVNHRIVAIGDAPIENPPRIGERWEKHHNTQATFWVQERGVHCRTRDVYQVIEYMAHRVEYDGAPPPYRVDWKAEISALVADRDRVELRRLMGEIVGENMEWVTRGDEIKAAYVLQALGFQRHRGAHPAGERFYFYSRMPVIQHRPRESAESE